MKYFLTFLWKRHNSTSNTLVGMHCVPWAGMCEHTHTHILTHSNTQTLTRWHTLPYAEPHCDGEGSAGQLRINAAWCKRPCAGFHTLANGRWSWHIPQEKEPQKEEICLLQLRLIVQFQLGISGPNYEDLGGPGGPRVRICEPYRKVTDTTLRMWGKASNAALIRLWLVSRQLKLADLSGMVRAGALSDSRLPLPFDWRGDFGRRLCRS